MTYSAEPVKNITNSTELADRIVVDRSFVTALIEAWGDPTLGAVMGAQIRESLVMQRVTPAKAEGVARDVLNAIGKIQTGLLGARGAFGSLLDIITTASRMVHDEPADVEGFKVN